MTQAFYNLLQFFVVVFFFFFFFFGSEKVHPKLLLFRVNLPSINPFIFLQSFGTDELYIQSKSLNRLLSQQSVTKDLELKKQVSIQNQQSIQDKDIKKELEKKQEVWDKDLQDVPLKRIIVLNAKEWWMILLGTIGAAIGGSILPLFAIFFGEILDAFAQPPDQVLGAVHLWAGLFFALAVISGVGALVRVSSFYKFRFLWLKYYCCMLFFYCRLYVSLLLVRT